MKAVVYNEYGPPEVLKPREVAIPAPQDDEVLVRVAWSIRESGLRCRKKASAAQPS